MGKYEGTIPRGPEEMGVFRRVIVTAPDHNTFNLPTKVALVMNDMWLLDGITHKYRLNGDIISSGNWNDFVSGLCYVYNITQSSYLYPLSTYMHPTTPVTNWGNNNYASVYVTTGIVSGDQLEVGYWAKSELAIPTDTLFNNDSSYANAPHPYVSHLRAMSKAMTLKGTMNKAQSGYKLAHAFIYEKTSLSAIGIGYIGRSQIVDIADDFTNRVDYDDRYPIEIVSVSIAAAHYNWAIRISRNDPPTSDIRDALSESNGVTNGFIDFRYSSFTMRDGDNIYAHIPIGVHTKDLVIEAYKNSTDIGDITLWVTAWYKPKDGVKID